MNDRKRPGYTLEEKVDIINISIHNQKDWGIFILAIFYFLCLLTIAGLLVASAISLLSRDTTPFLSSSGTFLLMVFGLILFSLFFVFIQALDNVFLQEDLHITGSSISIERSGFLMFRKKKVIPIEKIRSLHPTIQLSAQGSILVDFFMNTLKYGKLSIVTRQFLVPIYQICRGLSPDEAVTVLDKILNKFPQYQ